MTDEKKEVDNTLDAEGQKIIKDMADEEAAEKGKKPEIKEEDAGKKPEEKQKEADDKAAADAKVAEEAKAQADADAEKKKLEDDGKPKRTPKLMEAWEHEVYKGKSEKQIKELSQQITDLTTKLEGKSDSKKTDAVKAFAEKSGLDEETVAGLLELTGVDSLKKELSDLKGKSEIPDQEVEFAKEANKELPKLFEGDKIAIDKQAEVQKVIHDLAFTKRYASLGLDEIYIIAKTKGYLDDFIKAPGRKTAEGSRGGSSGIGTDGEKKDVADMTDEEFKKFSDEQGTHKGDKWSVPGQD